jgi:hypothetical protein
MLPGLLDGINYNTADATKATLVLDAPLKDFIYVAGSFNKQPTQCLFDEKILHLGNFGWNLLV